MVAQHPHTPRLGLLLLAVATLTTAVLGATEKGSVQVATLSDPVLATLAGAEIHESDVRREIRFLPASEIRWRDHAKMPQEQRWRDWIHRMSLRSIALLAADQEGLSQEPAVEELARKSARDWLLNQYHLAYYGFDFTPPSDEELRREVGVSPTIVPDRLRLSHIFLRTRSEEETARAKAQLAAWKQEITDLESFRKVAADHSDSQTARRDGRLGILRRGVLSPAVEEVLYALPEGTISDPLEMRGGVHLFFIEKILPAQAMPLQPRINRLRGAKIEQARKEFRQRALRLAQEQFPVERRPDGGFTVGSRVVDGTTFAIRYPTRPGDEATRREQIIEAELLFQRALATGWPDEGQRLHLRDLEADAYLGQLLERLHRLRLVAPSKADLRRRYDADPSKYMHPRKIDIRAVKAQVPPGQDPLLFMDNLTLLAARLRSGELRWDQATAKCKPSCELTDPEILDGLKIASRFGPRVIEALRDIEVGGVTDPVQQDHDFFVVGVQAISPRTRMTFEEATPRLTKTITGERRKALNAQLIAELLTVYEFKLTEAGRAHVGTWVAGRPATTATP